MWCHLLPSCNVQTVFLLKITLKCSRRSNLEHRKNVRRPGLRPVPQWERLKRSPDGTEGAVHPLFGPSGLTCPPLPNAKYATGDTIWHVNFRSSEAISTNCYIRFALLSFATHVVFWLTYMIFINSCIFYPTYVTTLSTHSIYLQCCSCSCSTLEINMFDNY